MNYSKLKFLQNQNRLSNDEMGQIIGITGVGFKKMIVKETCSVKYLQQFARHFNVSLDYFNDGDLINTEEPPEAYTINKVCAMCEEKDKMIELLYERISDKDDMIELLKGKTIRADCG